MFEDGKTQFGTEIHGKTNANRSEKALEILKNLGYIKVINLGGLSDAQELLGVEVVKS